jgi:hypothetical protein
MVNTGNSVTTVEERGARRPGADPAWRRIYGLGGAAAIATVAIVLIQVPILIAYPIPTTIFGHFAQLHDTKLIGLIDLDLLFLVGQLLAVLVFVALFAALRQVNRLGMTVALGLALGGILLYLAVNPTFSLLYLSDQYAAATTDVQRASFLTAGEALWANYQGAAFGVAFILSGIATLVIAWVMLGSAIFTKWTAYVGFVVGATMLLPPLPTLGTVALVASYVSLAPLVVWDLLVGWRLLHLARRTADAGVTGPVSGSASLAAR